MLHLIVSISTSAVSALSALFYSRVFFVTVATAACHCYYYCTHSTMVELMIMENFFFLVMFSLSLLLFYSHSLELKFYFCCWLFERDTKPFQSSHSPCFSLSPVQNWWTELFYSIAFSCCTKKTPTPTSQPYLQFSIYFLSRFISTFFFSLSLCFKSVVEIFQSCVCF